MGNDRWLRITDVFRLVFRFHVDNLSSAHIYLRMNEGDSWDQISAELLEDCAQLTKANSIDGMFLHSYHCATQS